MANLSDKIAPIGVLTPSSSIKDLSDVSSSMTPTDGQVLTYDTTNGWQAETAGALFGTVQTLTTDTTLTSGDNRNLLSCSGGITLTLPALSAGLTFGVLNTDASSYLILEGNTTSDPIDGNLGTAMLEPRAEAILVCDGTKWTLIGGAGKVTILTVQLSASGNYTPSSGAVAFLACCNGATGGNATSSYKGATGGGGYSEKFYTAPFSASYSYNVGAFGDVAATGGTTTFDTISIPSSAHSTNEYPTAGAAGSGGDFNATGGTGVRSYPYGSGGGGAATRAGNGGNGVLGYNASNGGAGGGTGGNDAVYGSNTGGAAATGDSASAYSLSTFAASVTYSAAPDVTSRVATRGASGYTVYTTYSGESLVIGSPTCGAGTRGGTTADGATIGASGHITILEFYA